MVQILHVLFLVLIFVSGGTLGLLASVVPVPVADRLGHRGVQRRLALEQGGLFATVEPAVRFGAALSALIPLGEFRHKQERDLMRSDYSLGLTADELIALSILSALGLGVCVYGISAGVEVLRGGVVSNSWAFGFLGACLGLALPTLQIREVIRERAKVISRRLPHAIEVAAMCMGAGLDFPGALRQLSAVPGEEGDALSREFAVILEQLSLGHTRKAALHHFAERVASDAVRDFVNAVVQAEEKGNPLAKVIQIQGRLLNLRRSVAAEEAAARAGVLLILPMMLLVSCILLLLLGPFMVQGMGF